MKPTPEKIYRRIGGTARRWSERELVIWRDAAGRLWGVPKAAGK